MRLELGLIACERRLQDRARNECGEAMLSQCLLPADYGKVRGHGLRSRHLSVHMIVRVMGERYDVQTFIGQFVLMFLYYNSLQWRYQYGPGIAFKTTFSVKAT